MHINAMSTSNVNAMRHLRSRDYRRVPWRNGRGCTAEIAVAPEGAGMDDFLWRVSTAVVTEPGAFSAFPGVDRILTLSLIHI